ncbi:hypothetical protein [Grimontia sp. NTOU-MAR1]|uniref:hypothetical protein n=1 Tax=Grimontia sp. NTOU-MAR1 TaxID=3111011 RepID=UPI002DBCC5A0|nr:hypothetical protein [Grimontia sp. NTOU-MAR1]WRV96500.1 hypothetical protein VP504_10300 [Grimontia sp. NTOU-MAR1]
MKTNRVDNHEPLDIDEKLTTWISRQPENPYGGPEYRVGILNNQGQVYRSISVEGLGDYVGLDQNLKKFGLAETKTQRGFDALFHSEKNA